jgi:hypothetical protein
MSNDGINESQKSSSRGLNRDRDIYTNLDKAQEFLREAFTYFANTSDPERKEPAYLGERGQKVAYVLKLIDVNKSWGYPFPVQGCLVDYLEWGGCSSERHDNPNLIPHLSAKRALALLDGDEGTDRILGTMIEGLKETHYTSRDKIMSYINVSKH